MSNINDKPKAQTISNNVLEVMNMITKHDFVHIREISRLAEISPTTAGNILKELEENSILAKKVLGKNCFYSLNKNNKAKKLLAMVENYKFLKECSDKNFSLFAENLLKNISDIKNLVDSAIACKENNNLSVFFITSLDNETIKAKLGKETEKKTGKITVLTKENFRNNMETDMIKSILKDYTIILGAEKFIDLAY